MLICPLLFFFIKCSNNFFTIKIINNICPSNCIFNFTTNKKFFRPVWCVSFIKNIFVFWNSYVIINFKFRIFIINFFLWIDLCIIFYINRFHLNCSMICIIISPTMSSNLSIYTFFDIEVMYLQMLVFNVLRNLWAKTDFPLLCIEYVSISLSFDLFLKEVLQNSFVNPYFVWFSIRFFQYLLKSINNTNNFFFFQRNNPSIFTKNIKNTQWKSTSFIDLAH